MRSTRKRSCASAIADEDDVRQLIDMARALEGLVRNAGTHAGGVVIAPSVLTDFAPLYCEEGSTSVVTQFDKDDVEAAGLVKFDFLGLRTLTIIDWAVRTINAERATVRRAGARHVDAADGRRADLLAAEALRDDGRLPARIARHEGPDQAPAAGHASKTSSRSSRCSGRARCSRAWSTTSSTASTAASAAASTTCTRT